MNDNQLRDRVSKLAATIKRIQDVSSSHYRDIRNKFETTFRQELIGRIQKAKTQPNKNFFNGHLQEILKRMAIFWAFKNVALFRHRQRDENIYLISLFLSNNPKHLINKGHEGFKVSSKLQWQYEQKHPLTWLDDPANPEEPHNKWLQIIRPLITMLKKDIFKLNTNECCFFVVVPYAGSIYCFAFGGRDQKSISKLYHDSIGASKLCQEMILTTCTELIYELRDLLAHLSELGKKEK